MKQADRTLLKTFFKTNNIPTQDNFYAFIDACINQEEDSIRKEAGKPVSIQAEANNTQELLFFYSRFDDQNNPNPSWRINQNPKSGAGNVAGFNITNSADGSRLFIKGDDGNVGIGTINPARKLQVQVDNNGLNLPLYLRNLNGTQGGNAVGIGFLNEAVGDWPKAAIVHERTAAYGVGSLKFLVNDSISNSTVSLNDVKMTITSNGNVGIGVATPNFPLAFGNQLGDKIALWGQSGNTYGFGIQAALLQIHSDAATSDIAFGWGSSTAFTETMRIKGNGTVGIGTSNPGYTLTIGNTREAVLGVENRATFYAKNTAGAYEPFMWPRWSDNASYFNYGSGGFYIRNNASSSTMFMTNGGNVGIGTNNPLEKLSVVGDAIFSGGLGIGTQSSVNEGSRLQGKGQLSIRGASPQLDFIDTDHNHWAIHVNENRMYFIREPWSYTDLVLDGKGNIGIGTLTPIAKLHVAGSIAYPSSVRYAYLNGNGNGGPGVWSAMPVSIYASHRVLAEEFMAFSDVRIKKDIKISDGTRDLLALNQLQVSDYRLRELDGYNVQKKGFVAQQVEEVLPEAVDKHANFIPSINALPEKTELVEGTLIVSMKVGHELTDESLVRLITPTGEKEVNIKVVDEKIFAVADWKEETTEVFVYGKQVDDFRTLNYDHIFCVGISAIQQLYKQMQQLKDELTAVKTKFGQLISREITPISA